MVDVFVSYKKEDVARVEPIARALAQAGYDVWWDHRIPPGRSYRDVIGAALQSAKCVIVVWSDKSANAQWVLDEADEGKKRNVLLPLLIDDVEIPYGFRQIEAARLVGWSGDPTHPEWRAALESVGHFVGRAAGGPPKPLVTNVTAPIAPPAGEAKARKGGALGAVLLAAAMIAIVGGGGYYAWSTGLIGAPAPQAAPIETPAPVEVLRGVRVNTADSEGFYRQADNTWVELAPSGVARFRFVEEREEAGAPVIFDETRNVRLRIEPASAMITEETPEGWRPRYENIEIVRGIPPVAAPPSTVLSDHVSVVWFDGGGAFARNGDLWVELSRDDGMFGGAGWREESRDGDTITLRDDSRQAGARIELTEGMIYLYFPDWGAWQPQWRIRAVDRAA